MRFRWNRVLSVLTRQDGFGECFSCGMNLFPQELTTWKGGDNGAKAFSSSYIRSLQTHQHRVLCSGSDSRWALRRPRRGKLARVRTFPGPWWEKGVPAKFPHSIDIPCQGLLSAVDRRLMNLSFYISHRIMGLCLGQEPRRAMISGPGSLSPGEQARSVT